MLLMVLALAAAANTRACASASPSASAAAADQGPPAPAQKDPHALPGRSAVVHLFEWKFSDIADECDNFLAPNGYAAVQTSPINDHISLPDKGHPWWERYQPMSYDIISRSGDETAFSNMVKRCNKAGIRVYVDVVFNHMTTQCKFPRSIGGKTTDANNLKFTGVPYGPNDFHKLCDINTYNDEKQVRNCLLSGLLDLNHALPNVRRKVIGYMNRLIDRGVAGFRVDAAKHMWPSDLRLIYSQVKNLSTTHGFAQGTRPFFYQEVIDLGGEAVKKTQYNNIGRVTEFKFSAELGNAFRGNNALKWLVNFGVPWGLLPSDDAVVFIDNHDNQRGHGAGGSTILTHKEPKLYKMAVAFMLAWPYGFPRVMSSYFFNDTDNGPPSFANGTIKRVTCGNGWVCEHRWPEISHMIAFRNYVDDADIQNWWDNDKQISFSRGNRGFIVFNGARKSDLKMRLQTGLSPGKYCDIISGNMERNSCTGKTVTVGEDGSADIEILSSEDNGVLAIYADVKQK